MPTLDSIITSQTQEEQQKELEEKLREFAPNVQAAIRNLLAEGNRLDEIYLPIREKSSILYIAPDFDEPLDFGDYK